MNSTLIGSSKISFLEVYEELINMSQNIAKKLEIPTQWIFIYFVAQNCPIKDFINGLTNSQVYIPSETETSKIFVSNKTLKCELCIRNSKIMIRNICSHIFCYTCLKNYIMTFYSHSQVQKTVLPLCISKGGCYQVISHEIVTQMLQKNQILSNEYKKMIANGFIKTQSGKAPSIGEKKEELR